MKLYVMRHGQTYWNVEERIQGQSNSPLTEQGILQAYEAKEKLKKFDIDLIVVSPLNRTLKTANIINEDRHLPIVINENLKPRNFAEFEGKIRTDEVVKEFSMENINDYEVNSNYKGIEKIQDVCNRVWSTLDILRNNYSNKNILIITHGGISRIIESFFEGIEDGKVKFSGVDNCEIKMYEINREIKKEEIEEDFCR